MRYWWVNHAQTARQEIAGGYLWSPKTEQGGVRSRFYDNMREAGPGDIVLSYFGTRVRRVGIVSDFALTSPKPEEFGSVGAYWSHTGWLLPVTWLPNEIEIAPKAILESMGPLLPATHSPVRAATGDGNQKAYLAEVPRALTDLVLGTAGLDLQQIEEVRPITTVGIFVETLDDLVEAAIAHDGSLSDTEREQLTRARRGQGEFRRRVMNVEPACRVTGISRPNLLIASHMKPWRSCGTADERLDGYNGLMLTPHVDFLFDRGLLGFEDDGRTILSSRLEERDAARLGLHAVQRPTPQPFQDRHIPYLAHHRAAVFVP